MKVVENRKEVIKINKRLRFTGAILAIAASMSLTAYAAADIRTYN